MSARTDFPLIISAEIMRQPWRRSQKMVLGTFTQAKSPMVSILGAESSHQLHASMIPEKNQNFPDFRHTTLFVTRFFIEGRPKNPKAAPPSNGSPEGRLRRNVMHHHWE
jgi:hypothetical protein